VPPLSVGAVHSIAIIVSDEVSLVGVPGADGSVAAIAESMPEAYPSPTTLIAVTLKE
jgi:hypothetical protein